MLGARGQVARLYKKRITGGKGKRRGSCSRERIAEVQKEGRKKI